MDNKRKLLRRMKTEMIAEEDKENDRRGYNCMQVKTEVSAELGANGRGGRRKIKYSLAHNHNEVKAAIQT